MEIKMPELTDDQKNNIAHFTLRGFLIYIGVNLWFGFIAAMAGDGFWVGALIANYAFWGILLVAGLIFFGVVTFKKIEEIINEKW